MLKRLLHIVIFLLAGTSISFATHILGGEISHDHLQNNKYRFYVKVYRDCAECLIGGKGGGEVSKDCGGFKVFLRSSGQLNCTSTELASFTPTFVDYKSVLPVCDQTRTLCDSNSNFNYGAEVHSYSVDIDLDDYSSYLKCGFEVYVKMSSRSDVLDNIVEKEALFYNFTFVNPEVPHNSPKFSGTPDFILTGGQPIRHKLFDVAGVDDSLVVSLATPMRDQERPLTFRSGYSEDLPLTVFCNGSSTCNADATNEPPIGITLDKQTGLIHFTPMKNGEQVATVYQMELWKKVKGEMVLSSIVRRDLHQIVIADNNSSPSIYTNANFTDNIIPVCIGDTLDIDFLARDLPELLPDGTKGPSDTVRFTWKLTGTSANIQMEGTSDAPYNKLRLQWAPEQSDLASALFKLEIEVRDDHCPLQAYGHATYWLKANPSPEITLLPRRLKCGNLDLNSRVRDHNLDVTYDWTLSNSSSSMNSGFARDTFMVREAGSYLLALSVTNEFGCKGFATQNIDFTAKQVKGPDVLVIGDFTYCDGDIAQLELESEYDHQQVSWFLDGSPVGNTDTYMEVVNAGNDNSRISAEILIDDYGLTCLSKIDSIFKVDPRPVVTITGPSPMCPPDNGIDLLNYVQPKSGAFASDGIVLADGIRLENENIPDLYNGGEYCFDYSVVSPRGYCRTTKPVCVELYPKPELIMQDVTNCEFAGRFLMNNLLHRPYGFSGLDLSWSVDGASVNIPNVANQFWYDLNGIGTGIHQIICDASNAFGCRTIDTASLILLDSVNITLSDIQEICQGDEDIDLNALFKVDPHDGIWNSIEYSSDVNNNFLAAHVCGENINLTYTYDKFGCFDSKTVSIDILCAPEVQWEYDGDSVCSDQVLQLDAFPVDGSWVGEGVSGDQWNTEGLSGQVAMKFTFSDSKCSFDYDYSAYVLPKANAVLPELPDRICQGDDVEITGMEITNGSLHFNMDEYSRTFEQGHHDFTIKPHEDRTELDLNFKLETYGASCVQRWTHHIDVDPSPRVFLLNKTLSGCTDFYFDPGWSGNSAITDWSDVSFLWDFGVDTDPNATISGSNARYTYQEPGNHKLHLTTRTEAGCEWSEELATIQVYASPQAYFTMAGGDYLSITNTTVQFVNESECIDPISFEWDFDTKAGVRFSTEESPLFAYPKDTGIYHVKLRAISNKGCVDSFTRDLRIGPDIQLYIPTAFSPNGKGPVETEVHKVSGENIRDYEIWILSRWGDIVYHSTDINGSWDGYYKGVLCQPGVYAYKIISYSQNGQEYKLGGTITLLR